jgi:hypothetical protein
MINENQRGFIALFSVIIISFVLVLMTITANFSGFLGRFNIFYSENKEKSNELADACIEEARLAIALNDYDIGIAEEIIINDEQCEYEISSDNRITTHACVNKVQTFYEVIYEDEPNVSLVSFKELENVNSFLENDFQDLSPCY